MVSKQPSCPWSNPNLAAIDSIVAFSVARRSLAELSTFSRDCNQSAAALTVKGILAQLPPSHATQLDASAQATLGSSSTPLALPPEYRPVALRESTRSSSYFEYSLKLYLALWQWANAFRSIRYAVESGWYGFIDLGGSLCESDGDGFGTSVSILDVASYIWDVCEAFWLPLASMWDTPALWGQCLRIVFDLWV